MDASALPRYATDPEGVIAEAVGAVEPALTPELIRSVVRATFPVGAQRRKLAELLLRDLSWLTQGRSESPTIVERLVQALREQGAVHVQQPRCGACDQARLLVAVLPDGASRICDTCAGRRRHEANPCAVCGRHEFRTRDREGRPRCRAHPPDDGADPLEGLCRVIQQLCPNLPEQTIAEAVRAVEPVTARQRELLWALEDRPDLLTGQGAHDPVKVLHLIAALRERGAVNLVAPACPYCGRNVPMPRTRDGLRCCAECRSAVRTQPCTRCGRDRPVMGRTHGGEPSCQTCRHHNPLVHQICAQCGNATTSRPAKATARRAGAATNTRPRPAASAGNSARAHTSPPTPPSASRAPGSDAPRDLCRLPPRQPGRLPNGRRRAAVFLLRRNTPPMRPVRPDAAHPGHRTERRRTVPDLLAPPPGP